MKIASLKTLASSRKTRRSYALCAIERDSMSGEESLVPLADKAMDSFNSLSKKEMLGWAVREQEYRQLTY